MAHNIYTESKLSDSTTTEVRLDSSEMITIIITKPGKSPRRTQLTRASALDLQEMLTAALKKGDSRWL